ncbi:sushi, nidogen and EGF-like domain-containing protein 1 [Xyrauchen texanus]|uniref:sushi, nidogen and EGF-like domain-containing protein 1 n=1 Tax=Xyrauchen texanus TaxID=154827 RepID=UPI00224222C4|nr:sushi, nidogen and EGF-like domain-containing protein 1 [Xyrauchen texanus]
MCDTAVSWSGWYRLFIEGQSSQMPDTCVDKYSCGTHAPLWINGQHPRVEDGEVTRDVCGHWGNDCCLFRSNSIQVKACPGNYFVYKFVTPATCYLAYCAVPTIFYPFGSEDTEVTIGDTSNNLILSSPFTFFGRTYWQIYVNNNGLLTFSQPINETDPYPLPAKGSEDFIAPLWTDLDDYVSGVYSFNQYTTGSVLTRATQEIQQHFPDLSFIAAWVFVATWDLQISGTVSYISGTGYLFQVVLMSGSNFSFILMNYGDCKEPIQPVQAGYDTANSTHYFAIPGSNNISYIPQLKRTSNVNVPGRWAFRVDGIPKYNIFGLQVRLTSLLNLTENGNAQIILDQLKQELIKHGLPNTTEVKLRSLQKIKP